METSDPVRVFLAAPFSAHLEPATGLVHKGFRQYLAALRKVLVDNGCTVFLAHEREHWGAAIMQPEECTPLDLEEMVAADIVVAIPGESGGVHIELGWASVLGKGIVLLLEKHKHYSPLILGLKTIVDVQIIWTTHPDAPWEELVRAISCLVNTRGTHSIERFVEGQLPADPVRMAGSKVIADVGLPSGYLHRLKGLGPRWR